MVYPTKRVFWKIPQLTALAFLLVLTALLPSSVQAGASQEFVGKVVGISDGDTIKVMHLGRAEKVRLAGIDCPERKQPFGTRAKQFTSDLAFANVVTVKVETIDQYGRTVGEVILPDGKSLNHELVRAGLAWWYRQYSQDKALEQLEEEARAARRGLWVDPNPIPPWDFRKLQRALR